jgi:hypothetical protein
MLKKLPTTAIPTSIMVTGIRIAHTLGGKKLWSSMFSSTNGCGWLCELMQNKLGNMERGWRRERDGSNNAHHEQYPNGVV